MFQTDPTFNPQQQYSSELERWMSMRTKTDLIRFAKDNYGIQPWQKVIQILKDAGFETFNPMLWMQYTNILREHWTYLKEARQQEKERIQIWKKEEDVLVKLAGTIQYVEVSPGKWDYVGTREAFKAKDALAALERERNIKKTKPFNTPGNWKEPEV